MSKTNPARGMRDLLPADVRKREYVIGIIKEVYESYGFEPLETPAVENLETLMGKYGEEGNQLIFKILKRGEKLTESLGSRDSRESLGGGDSLGSLGSDGNEIASTTSQTSKTSSTGLTALADLALRYDLTVPLARVVAHHKNDLPKFFKRYQIQPVWRADRPARGRFREFYQCDVDAIGSTSMTVEAEQIAAVSQILTRLGFNDFVIRINHRKLLAGILEAANIPENKQLQTLVILDKLDKLSPNKITEELEANNIPFENVGRLIKFMLTFYEGSRENEDRKDLVKKTVHERKMTKSSTSGLLNELDMTQLDQVFDPVLTNQFAVDRIAGFISGSKIGTAGLREIKELLPLLRGKNGSYIKIDPSLARGLSYYTGAIFEIVLTDGDFKGSIGGGGRYDGLIGMFGKEQIPACGFSLGLERILVVMDERGMFPPEIAESTPADVMITIWSEETIADSLKLAAELRTQGVRVTVYPDPDKFGKQMKYADQIKVPFVCVLGETEIKDNTVTLKNMRTGDQQNISRTEVAEKVKSKK